MDDSVAPERLRALDTLWLEVDADGPPIAIGVTAVCQGRVPGDDELVAMIRSRLPMMPRLSERIVPDPAGVRRPTWVPVDPDVHDHVHHLDARTVPEDGRTGQRSRLDRAVSHVMEVPMPRHRPLWDAWLVHGLPEGDWALVWRIHHAAVDGLGAMAVLGHGFDLEPEGGRTLGEMVAQAQVDGPQHGSRSAPSGAGPDRAEDRGRRDPLTAMLSGGAHLAGAAVGALGRAIGMLPHLSAAVGSVVPHPPSSLTGAVGDRRHWASAELDLDEVKRVARLHGGTVNDVILAVVTEGFRELLDARGDLRPGQTVRALVPVSLRAAGDGSADNQISALLVHLPVGEDDPLRRLEACVDECQHLKAAHAYVLGSVLTYVVDHTMPSAVQDAVVPAVGFSAVDWLMDTIVTNVPGPQFPLYLMGRRVRAMHPVIPVGGHCRTTVGIFSYDGRIDVGVTGDAASSPDVDVVADAVVSALQRLG